MIVYVDSSVVVGAYLPDEIDHERCRDLLDDKRMVAITGSWTRVEVTGALVRASAAHRGGRDDLLRAFADDIDPVTGRVTVVDAFQAEIENIAIDLVTRTGIRSLDAWHVACAVLTLAELAEPGEATAFATRDTRQGSVAEQLGLTLV